MRTQHRGESAIRIIFAKKHKWYVSVFPIPDHFSRIVCPFWTGSSYRTVQSPITPPFLTAQRSNRTAYCLFTRQDLPQKIPSLQIQFCGRKSCKICKKIFYFFAFFTKKRSEIFRFFFRYIFNQVYPQVIRLHHLSLSHQVQSYQQPLLVLRQVFSHVK